MLIIQSAKTRTSGRQLECSMLPGFPACQGDTTALLALDLKSYFSYIEACQGLRFEMFFYSTYNRVKENTAVV